MIRDERRRSRRPSKVSSPAVESLEARQLLSFYTGPTASRPVFVNRSASTISVIGGGFETVRQLRNGQVAITLYGTSQSSTLSITSQTGRPHFKVASLQVAEIKVKTGLLGSIQAGEADLVGSVTPLNNAVSTLQFNSVGPNSRIDVNGGVTSLDVGVVDLGPTGHIHVGGLTGASSLGSVTLDGGQFTIDSDVSGTLALGGLTVQGAGQFSIGQNVSGSLQNSGTLNLLGPNARLHIGALTGPSSSLGSVTLDGGQFTIDQDVTGTLTVSGMTLQRGGQLFIGHDLSGSLQDNGDLTLNTNGRIMIGHNLGNLNVGQMLNLSGGSFLVGNDVTGSLTVGGGLGVSNGGLLVVQRDVSGGLKVTGDLGLDSGGNIRVVRDLASLNVNGNLKFTSTAGALVVGGNLNALTINGSFQGKGTASIDLAVGLNLNGFTVLGGGAGQGGVQGANIDVAKDIVGLDIRHGIFNSLITAGALIDGTPQNASSGGNIGPDGSDAIFDSEILSGVQIKNLTINGDVRSDYVTNAQPSGYRTRIIAGENRQGTFISGGNLDNFQITGALIDAVLAASVAPFGGNGTLPTFAYGAPPPSVDTSGDKGNNTYDAPGGVLPVIPVSNAAGNITGYSILNELGDLITFPTSVVTNNTVPGGVIWGGTTKAPILNPNYSEVSYYNETLIGVSYDRAQDPIIDDTILPGSINKSFATAPVDLTATTGTSSITTTTGNTSVTTTGSAPPIKLSLPSKSTVLGGVISNQHGDQQDQQDFAGIFAADTSGVFLGLLPK